MIVAALTSTVFGIAAPAPPTLDHDPAAVLTVTETHLSVESRSPDPLLLVVAAEDGTPARALLLPPGAGIQSDLARGALASLRFELVQPTDGGWSTTGRLPFPRVDAGEAVHTWLFPSGVALCTTADGLVAPLLAEPSLLPLDGAGAPPLPAFAPPVHVPIPEPTERPEDGTPPELEKRPLPPV